MTNDLAVDNPWDTCGTCVHILIDHNNKGCRVCDCTEPTIDTTPVEWTGLDENGAP